MNEAKLARQKAQLSEEYSSHYLYRLDMEVTGMLLKGDSALVDAVTWYLRDRVATLTRNAGKRKYAILPGYGKRNVVLIEGNV